MPLQVIRSDRHAFSLHSPPSSLRLLLFSPFSLILLPPSSARLPKKEYAFTAQVSPLVRLEEKRGLFPVYLEELFCWIYVWVPLENISAHTVYRYHWRRTFLGVKPASPEVACFGTFLLLWISAIV